VMNNIIKCHDCGAREGEYHQPGCDMETCPFCCGQLISCDCPYNLLGIDASEGTWAYNHGLTDEQAEKWDDMLETKGRIPFVRIPVVCALCGQFYPDFFSVPDNEWDKYVIPELTSKVLCRTCYDKQRKLFPDGWRKSKAHHTVKEII